MSTSFDPQKFIDREREIEAFEKLLEFRSASRILTIRDQGGKGKSQLLEKLGHRCRTGHPRIPVSLIALDQLQDYSPIFVVKLIVDQLQKGFNLSFKTFSAYETARVAANYTFFSSTVNLEGTTFEGASHTVIASTAVQRADEVKIISPGQTTLTPAQEEIAQSKVIAGFFEDLKKHSAEKPIVLILDSYDRCKPELQTWILDSLFSTCFFHDEENSGYLMLVISGQELPRHDLRWPADRCEKVVKAIDELECWKRHHVEQCMKSYGFEYTDQDVDYFYTVVKRGIAPLHLIQMMHFALKASRA